MVFNGLQPCENRFTLIIPLYSEQWATMDVGPGGRDDKGKSAFPPAHCAEVGVVGSIPAHGQWVVPWVHLCDLSCAEKFAEAILYGVVICNFDEDL